MKKIEAFIKPELFDEVKEGLESEGYFGMSVSTVQGRGSQKGINIPSRWGSRCIDFLPKVKVEIVVTDHDLEKVITIIVAKARTGKIGDGRIFIYPVEKSIRVRTGEVEGEGITS